MMNPWNIILIGLLGLYLDYGLRLAKITHHCWTKDTQKNVPKERKLFLLVLVLCLFWPLFVPFSYLELVSKRCQVNGNQP